MRRNQGQCAVVYFSSSVTLSKGTTYYIGLDNNGNSQTTDALCYEVDANEDLKAYKGFYDNGEDIHLSKYNGSTWTDTNTKRLEMALIVDGDTGGGGGGTKTSSAPVGVM